MFIAVAYFKLDQLDDAIPFLQRAIRENEQAASFFLELCPDAVDKLMLEGL
jgi:hypothetical protein